jgi:hypothetical protein
MVFATKRCAPEEDCSSQTGNASRRYRRRLVLAFETEPADIARASF